MHWAIRPLAHHPHAGLRPSKRTNEGVWESAEDATYP